MKYYSTNKQVPLASLSEAVIKGLASDKGLYMPEQIRRLDADVIRQMPGMPFADIACLVADAFFGEDIEKETLDRIVRDTLSFETPVVHVAGNRYSLELFHGPTLAFKDVGARFMARLLRHFLRSEGSERVHVLVATSGDTGSAVANGFLGVEGIHVHVLYPKGKVSPIQECQFATLGQNITALEVDGTFDDCQALVKTAFLDPELNEALRLTSANSINVARFLPQAFYYFNAYAQARRMGLRDDIVFSVPSGNFGNLAAGLIAAEMGLPVGHFIAANNVNDVFLEYLQTGIYRPRTSVRTIANAMDVGDPSNFARILDLYGDSVEAIRRDISGCRYTDYEIRDAVRSVHSSTGYLLDPHGACAYMGLKDYLQPGRTGIFLETAHPAKFKDTIEDILGMEIGIPERLRAFLDAPKLSVKISGAYQDFKDYLLARLK